MIALNASRIALGGVAVLHDITFQARSGEMVALCGPNGAGKTTFLRALAGFLPSIPAPDPRQVAYLPQGARSAWGLTVGEVVALGRLPQGDANREAVARAMLARVIATEAKVLLLDKLTADLDPDAAHRIMALLAGFARGGMTVVVLLHALDMVRDYADWMVVLQRGRIVAYAPPEEAVPIVATAFGLPLGIDRRPRLLAPGSE